MAVRAARIVYDDLAARCRQLSSGPLGGDGCAKLFAFIVPNRYVWFRSFRGSKGESSIYLLHNTQWTPLLYISISERPFFFSGKPTFNETGVNLNFQRLLIIRCAVSWEALSSIKNLSATNSVSFPLTHYRRLTKSLKLTESTVCFSAARKKLFREMAVRAARIVSGDQAVRRRSLAPVR